MTRPLFSVLKTQLPRLPFCVLLAILAAQAAHSQEPFEFRHNDVVAIYGNGLADRMQHDPWVETVLQYHIHAFQVTLQHRLHPRIVLHPVGQAVAIDRDNIVLLEFKLAGEAS